MWPWGWGKMRRMQAGPSLNNRRSGDWKQAASGVFMPWLRDQAFGKQGYKSTRNFKWSRSIFAMIQQSHFWLYIQKNRKQDWEEIFASPCSLQQHSQQPRDGSHPSVCWWMDGWMKKENAVNTYNEILCSLKRRKSCRMLRQNETQGRYSKWSKSVTHTQKGKCYAITFIWGTQSS